MNFRLFLAGVCLASIGWAKPLEQSLGLNLTYLRLHALPTELPEKGAPAPGSLVLDLRFTTADREAAAALGEWLQARAKPASPVIVLANAETAPALLALLSKEKVAPGVVSIGPADKRLTPDIVLHVTEEADRTAYEALEKGANLDGLIAQKLDKVRRDEAAVAHERASAVPPVPEVDSTEDPGLGLATEANEPKVPTKAVAPPLDTMLQRAVQLHRALLALRKV